MEGSEGLEENRIPKQPEAGTRQVAVKPADRRSAASGAIAETKVIAKMLHLLKNPVFRIA
jgi:hypothetical protein